MTPTNLLEKFVQDADEAAFAELVRQHVDFVYAAALRQSHGDRHQAEEITQEVFVQLARKAPTLTGHPSLLGWLYSATRFAALAARRKERRRVHREQAFEAMNTEPSTEWEKVRPVIDEAMQDLSETDRQSVLMRFFTGQSLEQIGEQLGFSENAAQKRISRALDQLSAALARRGVTSTAAALGVALIESGVAAPSTLAGSAATAAMAATAQGIFTASSVALVGKISLAAAAVAAAGFTGGVWFQSQRGNESLAKARHEFTAQLEETQVQTRKQADRAALAEADTTRLLAAIEQARKDREAALAAAEAAALEARRKAALAPRISEYILQRGDTGLKIAEQTGTTLEELQALNPDVQWNRLKVGQKVRVRVQP